MLFPQRRHGNPLFAHQRNTAWSQMHDCRILFAHAYPVQNRRRQPVIGFAVGGALPAVRIQSRVKHLLHGAEKPAFRHSRLPRARETTTPTGIGNHQFLAPVGVLDFETENKARFAHWPRAVAMTIKQHSCAQNILAGG